MVNEGLIHSQLMKAQTQFKQSLKNINYDIKISWYGFADSVSPNLLPANFSKSSVNNVAYGSYLEKAIGSEAIGYHKNENVKEMNGIEVGWFVDQAGRFTMWKIVATNEGNKFFVLRDLDGDFEFTGAEEEWLDETPNAGIGSACDYDWAVWRNQLYLVSGEKYTDDNGNTGCVIRYDPANTAFGDWEAIDTGFGVANIPSSTGADGPTEFCPSIIEFYDDRMWLAGSELHCQQVKISEHANPYNVTGSAAKPFLGLLDTVPDIEDLTRPSTYILDQNGDCITALESKNGYIWSITNRNWYGYKNINVLNSNSLPAGLLWLDTLEEHKANNGTYSPDTVISDDEYFHFLSNSAVNPSFNTIVPVISNDSVDKLYVNRSIYVQERFRDIDWTGAAIGQYSTGDGEGVTFISGSRCGAEGDVEGGRTCIDNDTTLAFKNVDGTPTWTEIPYIHASAWTNDNQYTYWLDSTSGNLFRLNPKKWSYITRDSEGNKEESHYPFVMQMGKTGKSANDLDFSDKTLKYIWITAVTDPTVDIQFDLFRQGNTCLDCEGIAKTFHIKPCIDKDASKVCECGDVTKQPFVHQGGQFFSRLIDVSKFDFKYNVMDMRLTALSEGYFALHSLGVLYEKGKPISSNMLETELIEGAIETDITQKC